MLVDAAALRETATCNAGPRPAGSTVTAYWINFFRRIDDPERVAAYARLAGPAMREAGGRFLARGEPAHTFEGGRACRTTVIEFDSVDAAVAAYHSLGYQEALRVLGDAAERDLRIIPAASDAARPTDPATHSAPAP
jgi:uncharacterized protein (DUF1330 family)